MWGSSGYRGVAEGVYVACKDEGSCRSNSKINNSGSSNWVAQEGKA